MADLDEIHSLKRIFDDEIFSLVKYGFGKRNILVVLKDGMPISYLLKIKPHLSKLRKSNSIMVISIENIKPNNFAIDLLNIKLTYVVIYGQDPFKELEFDLGKIKRHITYEANKLLITLRNEILSRKWSWQLRDLLFSFVPRTLPLIVAHLHLKGEKVSNAIPDTINKYLKINPHAAVLLRINRQVKFKETLQLLDNLSEFLETLCTLK